MNVSSTTASTFVVTGYDRSGKQLFSVTVDALDGREAKRLGLAQVRSLANGEHLLAVCAGVTYHSAPKPKQES